MTSKRPRRRVIVAVEPRLLGDVLSEGLAETGLEVVVHASVERPDSSLTGASYDIAIITGTLPDDVVVDAVICLPDAPGGPAKVTSRAAGCRLVDVRDLSDIRALLGQLCRRR